MVWALVYLSITSPLGEHISYIPFHDDSSKLRMIPRNSKNYQQFLSVPSYTIITRSCNHQYNYRNHILKKSKDFRFPTQSSPKKKHQVANISALHQFFSRFSDPRCWPQKPQCIQHMRSNLPSKLWFPWRSDYRTAAEGTDHKSLKS